MICSCSRCVSDQWTPATAQTLACSSLSPLKRLWGFEDPESWRSTNGTLSLVTSPITLRGTAEALHLFHLLLLRDHVAEQEVISIDFGIRKLLELDRELVFIRKASPIYRLLASAKNLAEGIAQ